MAFCHHLLGRASKPLTLFQTIPDYYCNYKPENLYPLSQHTILWVFSLDLLSSGESTFMLNGGGWMKLKYFETSVPRLVCLVKSKARKQKSLERDIWLSSAKLVGDLRPPANGRKIVGCYMLRPFANLFECFGLLLGVVVSVCTPLQHGRNNTQNCWRNNVGSCCTPLQQGRNNTQHCWRNNVGSCLVSKKVA